MAQLQQVMTQNVVTVSPQQSVAEAAKIMSDYNVGAVPVVQDGQCLGIITDRDISLRVTAQNLNSEQTKIESVMSQNLLTGTPQMDVHEAANIMASNQIRRLPVLESNQLVGMVSLGDLSVRENFEDEAGQALSDISHPSRPQI